MRMVPLEFGGIARVLRWLGDGPGSFGLRHALAERRPGLVGDDGVRPRSVVFVRESGPTGAYQAFGAGEPGPGVARLADLAGPVAIVAPADWEPALRARGGEIRTGLVETWAPAVGPVNRNNPARPGVSVRRLGAGPADASAFAEAAPGWARSGWGSFDRLIARGAAFGVDDRRGRLAAVAWVFESDGRSDALGVATVGRYRRLGLGRAVASALLDHVEAARGRAPLWIVSAENLASRGLARSLGFALVAEEVVWHWTRWRNPAD